MHMHANTFILGYWHQFSFYFEKNCQKTGEYDKTITLTCKLVFAAETVDGRGHRLLPWPDLWQKIHRRSGGQSQPGNVQVCVSMGGSSLGNILSKCSTILWVGGSWGVCCSTKVRKSWTDWRASWAVGRFAICLWLMPDCWKNEDVLYFIS